MAERRIALSEGAEIYGSDGGRWGHVEEVGAHYLKVVDGLFGQREVYLPLALVARGDADRVELNVPVAEAKARARAEEPGDEPIYGESAPIPPEAMEAVGIPEVERAEVGTGEDTAETEQVRRAKGMA